MKTMTRIAAIAAVVALAGTLTACATDQAPAPVGPVPSVTVEPTTEPEPAPAPEPTVEPEPTHQGPVYTLEDGTKVEIDPDAKKLPKKVRKELAKKATEAVDAGSVSFRANFIRDAQKDTGKKVIAIWKVKIQPEGKPSGFYWAIAAVPKAIHPPVSSKAEAVAIAEAHVAAQDDPAAWEIVISNQ